MSIRSKIKILSPEQAIKIAAGEVVERPANIIKEAIENSLDAGSTKITIMVEQAGKKLIRIIDNGFGMTPDDAAMSVLSHATSKISTVEDLDNLTSFGFRGEALAAINSVSKMSLTTKTAQDDVGIKLNWQFGQLVEEKMIACQTGTTLEITDLFSNIPARKKFLKRDETEWRSIVLLFQAFCFDYPAIHFQLYHDEKQIYNFPAAPSIVDRSYQIFDLNFKQHSKELIESHAIAGSVSGVISSPHYYRYDRNQIFLFVNQRWVKNIDLVKSIMKGYAGSLPVQKFPAAIINIVVPADQVDVNIHPKKEEVKFLYPGKIESIITQSIRATLESMISMSNSSKDSTAFFQKQSVSALQDYSEELSAYPIAMHNLATPNGSAQKKLPVENLYQHDQPISMTNQIDYSAVDSLNNVQSSIVIPQSVAYIFDQPEAKAEQKDQQCMITSGMQHTFTVVGQYKKTYIIIEQDDDLWLIDQHAAHERILYEQFKANFGTVVTIRLLFPEFISLRADDVIKISPYLSLLADHGIMVDIFSDTQLIVQATPVHTKSEQMADLIAQFLSWISQFGQVDVDQSRHILQEKLYAKMACSAAVKAGDRLDSEQMHKLLFDLSSAKDRFSCPHGRPTFWRLPLVTIEKHFKRDYEQKADMNHTFL